VIRRSALFTATVIGAVVFSGSTPAQAADSDTVKRAIVVTVLKNLGVDPTPELVNNIISDLPFDALDSDLVEQVGNLIDNSDDPSVLIGQTVDSDGDGIPNADATTDDDDDDDNDGESDDDSTGGSSSTSTGSTGSTSGGTTTKPSKPTTPSDDDDESDDDNDDDDDDDDDESEDDDDNDGDDEDN
jgi:hypothetical protein